MYLNVYFIKVIYRENLTRGQEKNKPYKHFKRIKKQYKHLIGQILSEKSIEFVRQQTMFCFVKLWCFKLVLKVYLQKLSLTWFNNHS